MLITVLSFSGCIQSDTAKINGLSPKINDHLKNGDNYYNKAVSDLNKYSIVSASTNCNNALSEFNSAKSLAQEGLGYAQNSKDDALTQYMQLTISEINARLNATSELQQAVKYLQKNDTTNSNLHVVMANQYMDASMGYKSKKDQIVQANPSKFK